MYIYIYIIFKCIVNLYTYKFTSKCHSQSGELHQTRNYDRECSNNHPSLSTPRSKGLSRNKMYI